MKQKLTITFLCLIAFLTIACSINVGMTETPIPTTEQSLLQTAEAQVVTVYFTNEERFSTGTEPYEDAVKRYMPSYADPVSMVLNFFFLGPTPDEYTAGLRLVNSGFTFVRELKVENGIARVYLGGVCANNGAAYSVGSLIMKNLSQFPQISAVKIYDENDSTLDPDSPASSLPYCLEP